MKNNGVRIIPEFDYVYTTSDVAFALGITPTQLRKVLKRMNYQKDGGRFKYTPKSIRAITKELAKPAPKRDILKHLRAPGMPRDDAKGTIKRERQRKQR
ncbi:hypothetical protein [Mycobacteroides abscessus]|uniref:hypothetical protein n=1 Tax=Mycobacteroides abscessus TaxID=36809 RepID=UPI00188E1A6E|nr:hypothetical protein [Mycobacteroides abscessus]